MLLQAQALSISFGGLKAVQDVSLAVPAGSISALVGPNGAGKTTLFGLLSGFLRPDQGKVLFDGRDITGMAPQRRAPGHGAHLPDRAAVWRADGAREHRRGRAPAPRRGGPTRWRPPRPSRAASTWARSWTSPPPT